MWTPRGATTSFFCGHIPSASCLPSFLRYWSPAGPLSAQTSPLTGRVVDPLGGRVANAEIALADGDIAARERHAIESGWRIRVRRRRAGEYVLLVRAPGFARMEPTGDGRRRHGCVTVTLNVAGLVEDVTVQGAMLGTAATGKTNLPVRDLPMTVQSVPSHVIQEQGVNDLVAALQNVPGVYAFTNYGVYEGYTFRGFLDLFPSLANQLVDGVRHEGNRINTQLTNIERVEVLKGPSSALVRRRRDRRDRQPDSQEAVGAAGLRLLGRGRKLET